MSGDDGPLHARRVRPYPRNQLAVFKRQVPARGVRDVDGGRTGLDDLGGGGGRIGLKLGVEEQYV